MTNAHIIRTLIDKTLAAHGEAATRIHQAFDITWHAIDAALIDKHDHAQNMSCINVFTVKALNDGEDIPQSLIPDWYVK